ncbi:hypothetical protein WBP07_22130 (plasmid) [Novosphingobium sp. BL-8A]|uniref:hypothetical protein n=1 Tax=Novosphingobium sp. BL-8A TaxID=3127639 RepID=UPI0037575A3B
MIRDAVAHALEQRGLDNHEFLRQIRSGEQGHGPYMAGAFAAAEAIRQQLGDRLRGK